jgi:hypothetical protein
MSEIWDYKKFTIVTLLLTLFCVILPCVSAVEYQIPNSLVTFGYSGDCGLNITNATSAPSNAYLLYNDDEKQTYVILPPDSPDHNLDIIIVPVDKGLFGWLNWI